MERQRKRWEKKGDRYVSPTACMKGKLPHGGGGHIVIGEWPPDFPPHIWRAAMLYRACNARELTLSPSAAGGEDSWTMDAFAVLRSCDVDIDNALLAEARERK